MLHDNDEDTHTALVNRQPHAYENVDTCKNIPFLHTGWTVVVQHENVGPWTYGTIVGFWYKYHNGRSYKSKGDQKLEVKSQD